MINRGKTLVAWIRTQSFDSLIVLAVMISIEIVLLPLVGVLIIWMRISRFLKILGEQLAAKR